MRPVRHPGALGDAHAARSGSPRSLVVRRASSALLAAGRQRSYVFFAGYVVLQYVVLAHRLEHPGRLHRLREFRHRGVLRARRLHHGRAHKLVPPAAAGDDRWSAAWSPGLVGLGTGYLTLRLRGVFFSIATLALAVVVQTLITNWDFVGGSRGAYVMRPRHSAADRRQLHRSTCSWSCSASPWSRWRSARAIERSRLGYGFAAIRDDELAAEAAGVPTLRLKLIATTLSRRAHGHGRRAAALLRHLSRSRLRLQPDLCGEHHRHAADRRHDELARPGDRRRAARHRPAGRDGHHLVGASTC